MTYTNKTQELLFKTLLKNLEYKIIGTEKQDNDTTIVTVEVTNLDVQKVFLQVFQKMSQEVFTNKDSKPLSAEERFKQELEEKDKLLKEKEERYLRMYAEFENYKKRTEKEKQNTKLYAKADVLEMLLPVIDSMENAISIETEDENLKQGIGLMFEQIKIFLKKNEVEEIGKVRRNV